MPQHRSFVCGDGLRPDVSVGAGGRLPRLTYVFAGFVVAIASSGFAERPPDAGRSTTAIGDITACGPACIAVTFRLLDLPVDSFELDQLSDEDGASNFDELREYARSKGLHADVASLAPRALVELDRVAILHLIPPEAPPGDDAFHHFVVFVGSDPTGHWWVVDPVGTSPFSGLIDPESLVRNWSGRALIMSTNPLPWPLERGWWLRRWSIAAAWWIVVPAAFMLVAYAVARSVSKRSSVVATAAVLVLSCGMARCAPRDEPEAQPAAHRHFVPEPLRHRIATNRAEVERLLKQFDDIAWCRADHPSILMHALLGRGEDFALRQGDDAAPMSCLEWLLHRSDWQHFLHTRRSRASARGGPNVHDGKRDARLPEAHFGQALFYLSETDIDPRATMTTLNSQGDLRMLLDLVDGTRRDVHEYADLSFCLPVLLRWSDVDSWLCRFGSAWTISRLLDAHIDAEGRSIVCGGAHWRYALAFAVVGRHGRQLDPLVLDRAARRLDEMLGATLAGIDVDGRIPDGVVLVPDTMRFSHQAHSLEWLMVAVDDRTMRSHDRLHRAVSWTIREMTERWSVLCPRDLSHAAHALRLYRDRSDSIGVNPPSVAATSRHVVTRPVQAGVGSPPGASTGAVHSPARRAARCARRRHRDRRWRGRGRGLRD